MRLWMAIVLATILLAGCSGGGENREETGAKELTAPTEKTEIIEDTTLREKTTSEPTAAVNPQEGAELEGSRTGLSQYG